MEVVLTLHRVLTNMVTLYFLFMGVWGLFRAIRGQEVAGNYFGSLVLGQVLLVVQIILGGILYFDGRSATMTRPDVHFLYGAFVLIFLPFIYVAVLRGDDTNRGMWVWGFVCLFLFFMSYRFFVTAI